MFDNALNTGPLRNSRYSHSQDNHIHTPYSSDEVNLGQFLAGVRLPLFLLVRLDECAQRLVRCCTREDIFGALHAVFSADSVSTVHRHHMPIVVVRLLAQEAHSRTIVD